MEHREPGELWRWLSLACAGAALFALLFVPWTYEGGWRLGTCALLTCIGMVFGVAGRKPPRLAEDAPLPVGYWVNLLIGGPAGLLWFFLVKFRM